MCTICIKIRKVIFCVDSRQLKDTATYSPVTFQILKFSWLASRKPIWLWSSLSLHRKLTPAMTNGLTWCHTSAAPCMLLCTRRAFGNDLETECCQVNEIWAFKKCHFTSNLQTGICNIVKAQPLNLALVYQACLTYTRNDVRSWFY